MKMSQAMDAMRLSGAQVEQIRDGARFRWWVSNLKPTPAQTEEYMQGVVDGWTLAQWRAWVDRQMEAK